MTKVELASYLASLSSLLESQDAAGGHLRSQTIGAEFDKHWDLFKAELEKEHEDEARKRERIERRVDPPSHDQPHGEPRRGSPNRQGDEPRLFPETSDLGHGGSGPRG